MSNLLIIIDMQEGFRCKLQEQIIPNIKELIKKFKGDITFSCFENQNHSRFETKLKWTKFENHKNLLNKNYDRFLSFLIVLFYGYTQLKIKMKNLF